MNNYQLSKTQFTMNFQYLIIKLKIKYFLKIGNCKLKIYLVGALGLEPDEYNKFELKYGEAILL